MSRSYRPTPACECPQGSRQPDRSFIPARGAYRHDFRGAMLPSAVTSITRTLMPRHQIRLSPSANPYPVAVVFWPNIPRSLGRHPVRVSEPHKARLVDRKGSVVALLAKGCARVDRTVGLASMSARPARIKLLPRKSVASMARRRSKSRPDFARASEPTRCTSWRPVRAR